MILLFGAAVRAVLFLNATALLRGQLGPWVPSSRVDECADRAVIAVLEAGEPPAEALLLAAWQGFESGCDPNAISSDGYDCGIVQQRGIARHGHACSELRANPDLAVSLWISDLAVLRAMCGSTFRALGVLASGTCGGSPSLVSSRCSVAGLGPRCETLP